MIEKLKALGEAARNIVLFILAPIGMLVGYIAYIISQKNKYRDELANSKVETQLADTLAKREEIKNEADNAVADYNKLRDEYLRTFGGETGQLLADHKSSRPSTSKEGPADPSGGGSH